MIPGPWVFVLVALACWRVWRLLGEDDFPPVAAAREWVVGARWSEAREEWSFRRPVLAHFVRCPFCLGWWVSLGWWAAWLVWPHGAVVAAVPFAVSAAVGLVQTRLG